MLCIKHQHRFARSLLFSCPNLRVAVSAKPTLAEANTVAAEASDAAASDVRNAADLISCIVSVQKWNRPASVGAAAAAGGTP